MNNLDIDKLIKEVEESKLAKRCWFRHKWTVWSKPYNIKCVEWWNGEPIRCYSTYQKRMCLKCGRVETRQV